MIPKNPPRTLLLRTAGGCDLDAGQVLEVFDVQRRRLIADLRGFGPGDWAAPTRCDAWSVHDVVRHLCDGTRTMAAGPGDRTLDRAAGFDPRTTPRRWLAESAGESPADTLDRLATVTREALTCARERLALGRRFDVHLPYGPMDWTVHALHVLWDAWLHERDVFLATGGDRPAMGGDRPAMGGDRPADADATGYATAYGLFIAAVVAGKSGDRVCETIVLGGAGGGVFDLDTRGPVVVVAGAGPAAGGAPAAEVTDALAGRGSPAVLDELPAGSRKALTRLARFFNTPVETPVEA